MNEVEIERLVVRLVGDATSYQMMLAQAQQATMATVGHMQQATQQVEGFNSKLNLFGGALQSYGSQAASALLPLVGITSGLGLAFRSVNLAAEAEKTEAAFGVMLQSVEKGRALTKSLQQFAAETPLNMRDVQQATKILLQFGTKADDIVPTLRRIGDVTGGDAQRMMQMSLAFGQASASGRLMGQDLLQMINAGFNPLQEISRTTGRSMVDLKMDMEKGRITIDMLKNSFKTATSEGGQFKDNMLTASKTLSGLFSTMGDDIDAMMRSLGYELVSTLSLKDVVKGVSQGTQSITSYFQGLPPPIKAVTSSIVMLTSAVIASSAAWTILGPVLRSTTSNMLALGGAMKSSATAKAGFAALAAYLTTEFVFALTGGKKAVDDLQASLEKNERQTADASKIFSNKNVGPKQLDKEIAGMQKQLENAKNDVEHFGKNNFFGEWINQNVKDIPKFGSGLEAEFDMAKAKVKDIETMLAAAKAARAKIGGVDAKGQVIPKEFLQSLDALRDKFRQEGETLGMTSEQLEIYKLKQQNLHSVLIDNKIAELEKGAAHIEAAKKAHQATQEVKEMTKALLEQATTFGMTTGEAAIYKAQMMGVATGKEFEALKAAAELVDWQNDYNDALERGKQLIDQFDPAAKFRETSQELEELLWRGAINEDVFGLAMEDAKKKMYDAAMAGQELHNQLQRIDAVLVSSAEARSRISTYMDSLRQMGHRGDIMRQMEQQARGEIKQAVLIDSAEGKSRTDKSIGLLTDIRNTLKQKQKTLVVEAANL